MGYQLRFDATDSPAGAISIVVNQTFARRPLGAESPLGHRIRIFREADPTGARPAERWLEIAGVVEDFSAPA